MKNLTESSLSRIWRHTKDHESGTISAFRYAADCGEGKVYSLQDNKKRSAKLKAELLVAGYSVTKIDGTYIENYNTPAAKDVKEESYIVVDLKDSGNLLRDLKKFGEKYEQDSITFSTAGGKDYYLVGTNKCPNGYPGYNKKVKLGKSMFGQSGEFHSKINGRPFVFEQVLQQSSVLSDYSISEIRSLKELAGERTMITFKEFLEEGVYDPSIFKAIFLAGGPGSGKSYVVKKTMLGHGLRLVNSDDVFEKMLADAGLDKGSSEDIYSPQGQEIRGKAKATTKTMQGNYVAGRLGIVIDGTGKDYEKIKKQANKLKALGYDVSMVFVNTSIEVAQERNAKRARKLPPAEVVKMWNAVQNNIGRFQGFFGGQNFIVVDNNDAGEDVFQLVWKQVMKLARKKPESKLAKQWIANELQKKKR